MFLSHLHSHETQRNGLVLILDMTRSNYWNFDYDLSRKILKLLQVCNIKMVEIYWKLCGSICFPNSVPQ